MPLRYFGLTILFLAILILPAMAQETSAAEETSSKVEGLSEQVATMQSDVEKLKTFKISGYVQARFEANDSSADSVTSSKQYNLNNFYIRRGRLKVTYNATANARAVVYFDASKNTLSLKECYIEYTEPWTGLGITTTFGQQNMPFGYEIERSSSMRELPERSLAENVLFNGERDRGLRISVPYSYFALDLGVWNGQGINNPVFTWQDPTRQKDVSARLRGDFGWLALAGSFYQGQTYIPGAAKINASSTWNDANRNGIADSGEVAYTNAKDAVPAFRGDKQRIGADIQLYGELLPIGSTALMGEMFLSRDRNNGVLPDSIAKGMGYYAMLVQNLTGWSQFSVRYDFWDPNTANDSTKALSSTHDARSRIGLGLNFWPDPNVRLTLAYDLINDENVKYTNDHRSATANEAKNPNLITLQLQYKY